MFETIDVKAFEKWFDEWYKSAKQFKMSNKEVACAAFLSGWNAKETEQAARIAALEADKAKLIEALEFFIAFSDVSGDYNGEWQTYAYKRWGGVWSVHQVTQAEKEARRVLAEVK